MFAFKTNIFFIIFFSVLLSNCSFYGFSESEEKTKEELAFRPVNESAYDTDNAELVLAGNTFDPWAGRDRSPNDTNSLVHVSYNFEYSDKSKITGDNGNDGDAWIFTDLMIPKPIKAAILHWQTNPPSYSNATDPRGRFTAVNLGRRVFGAYEYCLSSETVRDLPLVVYKYGIFAYKNNVGETGQLYVKRFIPRNLEADGSRVDLVFLEDIGRSGYRCSDLSDFAPRNGNVVAFLESLTTRANQAFDVVQ
ncbi:MAG: hypothetical protein AAF403_05030 [Pseudomonadota bacterium]